MLTNTSLPPERKKKKARVGFCVALFLMLVSFWRILSSNWKDKIGTVGERIVEMQYHV